MNKRHEIRLVSFVLVLAFLLSGQTRPTGIIAQPRKAAQTPQPRKQPEGSAFVNRIEAATVIFAALSNRSELKSFGTGFIVEHAKRPYVVTCKHVVLEAKSASFFAIHRPLKTRAMPRGYVPIRLRKPIYHPSDGITGTYDIAVLEIVDSGKKTLASLGISPLVLAESQRTEYAEGTKLAAAGYPVEYAERELAVGKFEPLPPLRTEGTVRHLPLQNFTQSGFGGTLREGYFAQTVEGRFGKGASGGPVYVEGGEDVVVGILLGVVDVKIDQDNRITNVSGFVFASSVRIIEALNSHLLAQSEKDTKSLPHPSRKKETP